MAAPAPPARKLGNLQTMMAGFNAGLWSRTMTAPLDVTKILFQLQEAPIKAVAGEAGAKTGSNLQYTSMTGAMQQIMKEEGVKGLWKGNVVACMRLGPYRAIYYFAYETVKDTLVAANKFCTPDGRLTPIGNSIAGGIFSGPLAVMGTYPLDFVKTRLTIQKEGTAADGTAYKKTYNGTVDCLQKVVKTEGFTALYKGLTPTLAGVVPMAAGDFAVYMFIRNFREEQVKLADPNAKLGTFDFLAVGAVTGAIVQTATFPFDLMRKRFMAQSDAPGMLATKYDGILDCITRIVKAEGILGLWKGTVPNLCKVIPYTAIQWAAYEGGVNFFHWCNDNGHNPSRK